MILFPGPAVPARGPQLSRATFSIAPNRAALSNRATAPAGIVLPPPAISFGHPVISGIGGVGFEQDLRLDPSNASRLYTSAPGSAGANTSWIWRSLDAGRSFKWIPNATAMVGKVTTCNGGGDTELAVDGMGRLYFNDLTLANFSTARSDDFGLTLTCSDAGVPDTAVDRQWYAIDGDPLNGGSIYLANDEIGPGGVMCGGSVGNNVLVMYRSPVTGAEPTAGITFGPANHVTPVGSCDEAIMGNNEVSPVGTFLGQPNGAGGYATLATPAKHVFVIHDNAVLNQILIGRCFPVAFGAPIANVSDPSGLNCTDLLVADLGVNAKTGGNFPTMAIDRAGNLYAVWEQAPLAGGVISSDVSLMYSYSTNEGNTWSTPMQIDTSLSPVGQLHQNIFAWISAGDDGRINVAWYGTPGTATSGSFGPDDCNTCSWSLWMTQSINAHSSTPVFMPPILASEHPIHYGNVQTLIGGQNQLSNRALGDFLQIRTGSLGEAQIAYSDSNNIIGSAAGHGIYVRQNGGPGLTTATSPVNISGLAPFNSASDPSGDGKFEASGVVSANMPQLDITRSSISRVTTAPCSPAAPCYRVEMQLNDLSLAPSIAQDPDPDLVWSTQWLVSSATDPAGGKNFHVYAESNNGAALQCFAGENAIFLVGGGAALSYPGNTQLPAANCQSTLGPNGSIVIYVPLSMVDEPGAIDARLHEVTASTMTLSQPANTNPSLGGIGGSLFDLIDVVQGYVFDPNLTGAVSRKTHGAAGTFDIDLPFSGAAGIEDRVGQGANADAHQVVVNFTAPISFSSVAISAGNGAITHAASAGSQLTIDFTAPNAQTLTLKIFGVDAGNGSADVSIPISLLLGDTNANGMVNATDISEAKAQSGLTTNGGNFRLDVNANGAINSSDVSQIKAKAGTALPP
ncbi:MAG: dockerin type I domain-containing protein [Chthoniobacterales bacterium]